jgi:hypothetical protein
MVIRADALNFGGGHSRLWRCSAEIAGREQPAAAGGEQAQSKSAPNAGHDLFGPTKVWAVHLDIPADEFDAMQPAPPTFAGPGNPPQPAKRREDKGKRDGERKEQNQAGRSRPLVIEATRHH